MNALFAIARREFEGYFANPVGWVCLAAFAVLSGFFFVADIVIYTTYQAESVMNPSMASQLNINDALIVPWFGQLAITLLFVTPALSMRLIAEDRRSKAIELLLTSPVSSGVIASGKMLGAAAFAVQLMLITAPGAFILVQWGDPDTGVLLTNYLALFLLTLGLMTMGLFFSSLTESQVVALMLSLGTGLLLWIVGWVAEAGDEGTLKTVVEHLSLISHLDAMGNGVLRLKNIVYLLSFTAFFTFATAQRVEALRWR